MKNKIFSIVFIILIVVACRSLEDIGVLVPPTVDEDSNLPQRQITIGGISRGIHVLVFGDPHLPVLFVLHGSFTDIRPYINICEGLSDKYFVVLWDQRGCGLSERISESEFTFHSVIEEINKMKEIYSPQNKITLFGHSWGGGLAALYAAHHPENINQLVLSEPMPLRGSDMDKIWMTLVDFDFFDKSWNNFARHSKAISPSDHEQIDYQAQMMLQNTMTKYHCDNKNPPPWSFWRVGGYIEYVRNKRLGNPQSGFTYDFTPGLENYTDTVMILGGSCSSLGYDMQLTLNKEKFVKTKVIEIANAGHRMNMEQYDALMAALKEFLYEY